MGLGLLYINMIAFMHVMGREAYDDHKFRFKVKFSEQMKRLVAANKTVQPILARPDAAQQILQNPEAVMGVLELMRPSLHDLKNPE